MPGIGNISGVGGASQFRQAMETLQGPKPQESKGDFAQSVRKLIDGVDNQQQQSATRIADLVSGKTDDALPVVTAMAKADLSFKLLLGVRNKVVEAYKQTMNMQI